MEDGGPTEFELPLNAGAINLFVFEEKGKPFGKPEQLHKSLCPLDGTGAPVKNKTILLSGDHKNPIVVPPGRPLPQPFAEKKRRITRRLRQAAQAVRDAMAG